MKLNVDCVRDVLLTIEEHQTFGPNGDLRIMSFEEVCQLLKNKYSSEDIVYTLKQIIDSRYADGKLIKYVDGSISGSVMDIAPCGHEFLANIKSDTNWNKVKEISKNLGTGSLTAIKDISTQVVANLITSYFQG